MGQYVEKVPEEHVFVNDPWEQMGSTIDYTRSYATEMGGYLIEQINILRELNREYTPDFSGICQEIKILDPPEFPDRPDLSVDLSEYPNEEIPDPIILPIDVDFTYQKPTAPAGISPNFDYTPGSYQDCLLTHLCEQTRQELINGGTGLSDLVYHAIIARNSEERRNAEDNLRRRAYSAIGESGFDLAGGIGAAVVLELEKEIFFKDIDAINNVTIKDFELADANSKFIKEFALKIDTATRQNYDSDENRKLEAEKIATEMELRIYDSAINAYIAEWQGIEAQLKAAVAEVDAITKKNESEIKVFLGRADVLKTKILTIASENESKVKVAQVEADIYKKQVEAINAEILALVREVEISLEAYRTNVNAIIAREEINLKAFADKTNADISISDGISRAATQSVASALGAISTHMSYGYTGQTSRRYSTGLTNSLSEGHSYTEA
jgi:hypothetical protein